MPERRPACDGVVCGRGGGGGSRSTLMQCMVVVADVRALALTLPCTTEHLIHDRVKFRVRQIVYCAFSRDETLMGFAFPKEARDAPKEARDALVAAEPRVCVPRTVT
jgi:hypothetical protein